MLNHYEPQRLVLSYDHDALTATTTVKLFQVPAGRKFVVEKAKYINPTGLVGDATNAFMGEVKNGATVVATLFNTDTGDAGGATLAVDTFVEGALSATLANRWFVGDDVLSLVLTEDGVATLPAGRLVIEGRLY